MVYIAIITKELEFKNCYGRETVQDALFKGI
jgi:hypothetical protein